MGIYLPSFDPLFSHYGFLQNDGVAENYNFGQIAASREKLNLGSFGWDSSPELSTKKLDNSPIFPSVTYTASTDQLFKCYRILHISKTAENSSGQHNSWKNKIPTTTRLI
jgi:hypothetical protein